MEHREGQQHINLSFCQNEHREGQKHINLSFCQNVFCIRTGWLKRIPIPKKNPIYTTSDYSKSILYGQEAYPYPKQAIF